MPLDSYYHSSASNGPSYFSVEENDGASAASEEFTPLTWRKGESVDSDCTIVAVTNDLQTRTYHVHKSVVCFGPRQSRYFAKCIQEQKQQQKRSKKENLPSIKVELNERDIDNFELLLDFIYEPSVKMISNHLGINMMSSSGTPFTAASTLTSPSLIPGPSTSEDDSTMSIAGGDIINTDNSVSLRFLARKFQVDAAVLAVNRFIQRDLNFSTGPSYLTRGYKYSDDRLVASAQRLCTENFDQIELKALTKLPFELFRMVVQGLESFDAENRALSIFTSDAVFRYFEKNKKHVSARNLIELTDPLFMPCMSPDAAIGFTSLMKELDSNDATSQWSALTSLANRCSLTVVQEYGWSEFSVKEALTEYLGSSPNEKKRVSRIDSLLYGTSLAAALERAQEDFNELKSEQGQLALLLQLMHTSMNQLEELSSKKDMVVTKQQEKLEASNKRIRELEDQVVELQRSQRGVRFSPEAKPPIPVACMPTVSSTPTKMKAYTPEEIMKDLKSPSLVASIRNKVQDPGRSAEKEQLRKRSVMNFTDSFLDEFSLLS